MNTQENVLASFDKAQADFLEFIRNKDNSIVDRFAMYNRLGTNLMPAANVSDSSFEPEIDKLVCELLDVEEISFYDDLYIDRNQLVQYTDVIVRCMEAVLESNTEFGKKVLSARLCDGEIIALHPKLTELAEVIFAQPIAGFRFDW